MIVDYEHAWSGLPIHHISFREGRKLIYLSTYLPYLGNCKKISAYFSWQNVVYINYNSINVSQGPVSVAQSVSASDC